MERTDNLNIKRFRALVSPQDVKNDLPVNEHAAHVVATSRIHIQNILTNKDKRRLVITGPCSLHDRDATLEYARRLNKLQAELSEKVLLVMRAYFEKPRTTLGWKGMLYDPHLDGSYDIECGLRQSASILLDIAELGLAGGDGISGSDCAAVSGGPGVLGGYRRAYQRVADPSADGQRLVDADRI